MNIWNLMILAALIATAGSGIAYALAGRMAGTNDASLLSKAKGKEHSKAINAGRLLMAGSLVFLLIASAGLLSKFLGHDFSYEYVAHNSSRGLDNLYIVSAGACLCSPQRSMRGLRCHGTLYHRLCSW